jgi:hypothetical protein
MMLWRRERTGWPTRRGASAASQSSLNVAPLLEGSESLPVKRASLRLSEPCCLGQRASAADATLLVAPDLGREGTPRGNDAGPPARRMPGQRRRRDVEGIAPSQPDQRRVGTGRAIVPGDEGRRHHHRPLFLAVVQQEKRNDHLAAPWPHKAGIAR